MSVANGAHAANTSNACDSVRAPSVPLCLHAMFTLTFVFPNAHDHRYQREPRCGEGCAVAMRSTNGSYSTELFAARAVDVINAHNGTDNGLFVYLAFQAVHAPDQVPSSYTMPYVALLSFVNSSVILNAAPCCADSFSSANVTHAANMSYAKAWSRASRSCYFDFTFFKRTSMIARNVHTHPRVRFTNTHDLRYTRALTRVHS